MTSLWPPLCCLALIVLTAKSQSNLNDYDFKVWVNQIVQQLSTPTYASHSIITSAKTYPKGPTFVCRDPENNQVNILILADSIGRQMVENWCNFVNGKDGHIWGENNVAGFKTARIWGDSRDFNYEKGPTRVCTQPDGNVRIGFMHMFGSSRTGPYAWDHRSSPGDPFADTEQRIPEAIRQYRQLFGIPDFVLFRSDLWDIYKLKHEVMTNKRDNTTGMYENAIAEYLSNYIWIRSTIKSILPRSLIGTHTIRVDPNSHFMPWCGIYQDGLRNLSTAADHFVYDWDRLVANVPIADFLADDHHPNEYFSIRFASLLATSMQAWICSTRYQNVVEIVDTNSSDSTSASINSSIQRLVANKLHRKIILSKPTSTSASNYYVEFGVKRVVPSADSLAFLSLYRSTVTAEDEQLEVVDTGSAKALPLDQMSLDSLTEGVDVPYWLKNGSLVIPLGTKQVFWLVDGTKRPVQSSSVFFRMGWDFSEIVHLNWCDCSLDFDAIPLGSNLD